MTNPNLTDISFNELPFQETDWALDIVDGVQAMDLSQFGHVEPAEFNYDRWQCRTKLDDLLRPNFIGARQNLRYEVIPDAYDALLSASERGQVRAEGRSAVKPAKMPLNDELLRTLAIGVAFHSELTVVGEAGHSVRSEAYYLPVPFSRSGSKYIQHLESQGGICVARVVMRPEVSVTAHEQLQESIKRAGGTPGYNPKGQRTGTFSYLGTNGRRI